jgi:hypothetical protein
MPGHIAAPPVIVALAAVRLRAQRGASRPAGSPAASSPAPTARPARQRASHQTAPDTKISKWSQHSPKNHPRTITPMGPEPTRSRARTHPRSQEALAVLG